MVGVIDDSVWGNSALQGRSRTMGAARDRQW